MSKVSDGFCILPWVHLSTTSAGTYRVCCESSPPHTFLYNTPGENLKIFRHSVAEAWNSEKLKELRLEMLKGQKPATCFKCHREEQSGLRSSRQVWNARYQEYIPQALNGTNADGSVKENLIYLDLRLGNLCNIRCIMCSPHASNQWLEEWEKVQDERLTEDEKKRLVHHQWPNDEAVMRHISDYIENLQDIYLTGGEPTLAKNQYELLDLCIRKGVSKKIGLKYNTNMTNIPEKLLEYWKQFRSVQINASIDGFGALDEYIRFPTKWSVIDKNLRTLNEMKKTWTHLSLQVHTCVQTANVLNLSELFDYLADFENIDTVPFLNVLDDPPYLNVRILPEELKKLAAVRLKEWQNRNAGRLHENNFERIDQLISYMNHEDWSHRFPNFLAYISRLEGFRKNNLASLVPEFY